MEAHAPSDLHSRIEHVRSRVESGWKALLRQRSLALGLTALTGVMVVFLLLWALESYFYLASSTKTAFVFVALATGAALAYLLNRHLDKPQFRQYYADLAKSVGNEPLRNALDLHLDAAHPSLFHTYALRQNLDRLPDDQIQSQQNAYGLAHPSHQSFRRSAMASGILFFLLILAVFIEGSGVLRSLQFWKTFQPPIPFSYHITPGNQILEQGAGFQATVRFEGDVIPRQVAIGLKTAVESDFRLQQMTKVNDHTFVSEPFSFTNTTEYFIQMDRFRSETFTVEIQLLPRFEELTVTVTPPPHTRLEPFTQSYPFTVVEAYPGTKIDISALANKALQWVSVRRSATADTTGLEAGGDGRYSYSLTTAGTDTLSFELRDNVGFENRNPFQFIVSPLVDQYPAVIIVEPDAEINLLTPEIVQVGYEFRDDFGFQSAQIRYEIKKAFGQPISGSVALPRPAAASGAGLAPFDLPGIGAKELDEVEYWIEIRDNDAVAGFKAAQSQRQRIKLASMAEYLDLVDEKEQNVQKELQKMDEQYRQFEQQMQQFQQDLKTNQLDDFNRQQVLEELQEKQEQVNESARQLRDQFEQLKNEFRQNQILSPETLQQYEQLQKLIEEIDSPELRDALRQMQEALERMDPNQLREAIQNMEFNEELYKQRLERTLELFKQVKTQAEMDKLAKTYEELARRQREVPNESDLQKQREQEESIKNDLGKTQEQLDKLNQNAPKASEEELKKLQEELKPTLEETQKNLEEILKKLEEQQKQQGGQQQNQQNQQQQGGQQQPQNSPTPQQQEVGDDMEQMAGRIRESMQQMGGQQNQVNVRALRSILRNLLLLSETQEEIAMQTAQQPFRSNGFVDLARRENTVNHTFGITVDSLLAVASRVPQLSNIILEKKVQVQKNLSNAMTFLAERDNANASSETRFVLSGINELGTLIANLLDQMENQNNSSGGEGSGSMMQMMQEMSGQQQQLNQMLQDLINDIQGERLTQDQMERFNQMARQQNAIRQQIEELKNSGSFPDGDRIMSELERLAEEMEDAINDIRGGRTDRSFVRRQQNILSRMLEAEKAIQEREEDEKRKGNTADQNLRAVPPEMTLEELRKQIRSRLSDPNLSRFSDDYQKLIEKYFEVLERRERR